MESTVEATAPSMAVEHKLLTADNVRSYVASRMLQAILERLRFFDVIAPPETHSGLRQHFFEQAEAERTALLAVSNGELMKSCSGQKSPINRQMLIGHAWRLIAPLLPIWGHHALTCESTETTPVNGAGYLFEGFFFELLLRIRKSASAGADIQLSLPHHHADICRITVTSDGLDHSWLDGVIRGHRGQSDFGTALIREAMQAFGMEGHAATMPGDEETKPFALTVRCR